MTLVCCWVDDSYGRNRITAVANSRAADLRNDEWHPRSDQTVKLFRIPVQCHRLDDLDRDTGSSRTPYYLAEVGIGFAGYCFEAMTIITLFIRAMEQLVSQADEPRPDPDAMACVLTRIATDYFAGHTNREAQHVQFLFFGFCAEQPWIARVGYVPGGPTQLRPFSLCSRTRCMRSATATPRSPHLPKRRSIGLARTHANCAKTMAMRISSTTWNRQSIAMSQRKL